MRNEDKKRDFKWHALRIAEKNCGVTKQSNSKQRCGKDRKCRTHSQREKNVNGMNICKI